MFHFRRMVKNYWQQYCIWQGVGSLALRVIVIGAAAEGDVEPHRVLTFKMIVIDITNCAETILYPNTHDTSIGSTRRVIVPMNPDIK